tara:strand:+ start:68 stop:253 length:186 start_codon:yes stop_codon:yes gene_type:complete
MKQDTKRTKIDRLSLALKAGINLLLFTLCAIYSFTDMGDINDVWFVLFMLCMLRLVEGVDK